MRIKLNMPKNVEKKSILLLCLGLGITISFFASVLIYKAEQVRNQESFSRACQYRLKYIEDIARDQVDALYSVRDFFDCSEIVQIEEFDKFTKNLLFRQPYIYEFRWIKKIQDKDRESYEQFMRNSGFKGFAIKEYSEDNKLIISPKQKEYFSIHHISP